MSIISIANQKGGWGKPPPAKNLAAALTRREKKSFREADPGHLTEPWNPFEKIHIQT